MRYQAQGPGRGAAQVLDSEVREKGQGEAGALNRETDPVETGALEQEMGPVQAKDLAQVLEFREMDGWLVT